MIARASPTRSASTSDLPTLPPGRENERVRDAAADDQRVDFGSERVQDGKLGRDFGSADDGDKRSRRIRERLAERIELRGEQRTGASDASVPGDAVRGRLGAVRGAECVIDVNVAKARHLPRQRVVVLLLAGVEAAILEQHNIAGLESACQAPPSTQSLTSGTGRPRSSDSRRAIGASESFSLHCPSVGRPRCEVTMMAPPRAAASSIPGTDALILESSVMPPASSCGTFMSLRMNTRLPRTSVSASRRNFMGFRCDSRAVASFRCPRGARCARATPPAFQRADR